MLPISKEEKNKVVISTISEILLIALLFTVISSPILFVNFLKPDVDRYLNSVNEIQEITNWYASYDKDTIEKEFCKGRETCKILTLNHEKNDFGSIDILELDYSFENAKITLIEDKIKIVMNSDKDSYIKYYYFDKVNKDIIKNYYMKSILAIALLYLCGMIMNLYFKNLKKLDDGNKPPSIFKTNNAVCIYISISGLLFLLLLIYNKYYFSIGSETISYFLSYPFWIFCFLFVLVNIIINTILDNIKLYIKEKNEIMESYDLKSALERQEQLKLKFDSE